MKLKVKNKLLSLIFVLSLFFFSSFFPSATFAQQSFPTGGVDLNSATEILPGQYQGGYLNWEDGTTTQQAYYLSNVKNGQVIQGKVRFSGSTNLDFRLYDANKDELAHVYGSAEDMDTLIWLTDSTSKSNKYYLLLKNDAVNEATNLSLDLRLIDYFDANSQMDAGGTIDQAVSVGSGSYQGYLSGKEGKDEIDYYRLALKKGQHVSVKITPPSQDSIEIGVYDVNRSLLDDKTPTNEGAITTLSFIPANDGYYYLKLNCYYGCEKIFGYTMEISGAVLPTGGGIIVSQPPSLLTQTTNQPDGIIPSGTTENTVVSNFSSAKPSSRDFLFLGIIAVTVLIIIVVTVIILNRKGGKKEGSKEEPAIEKTEKKKTEEKVK